MHTEKIVWKEQQGIRYLIFPRFEESGLFAHAFTTRPFDLGFGRKSREEVIRDRKKICRVLNINFLMLTAGEQVHGVRIIKAGEEERGRGALGREGAIRNADGFISNVPGVPLAIFTADCVPLFILDPIRKVIGLVHAGWRGTLNGMSERAIARMEAEYGSRPEDMIVALGPSIGPCCYQVGSEVVDAFRERYPGWISFVSSKPVGDKWTLDLWEANRSQLVKVNVKDENIINSQMCTSCRNDIFFSRRRDGYPTGRMMSVMML